MKDERPPYTSTATQALTEWMNSPQRDKHGLRVRPGSHSVDVDRDTAVTAATRHLRALMMLASMGL